MKYGNRPLWKRIISSPLTMFALVILFGILTKAVWSIHQRANSSSEKLAQTEAELQKLESRENELRTEIDRYSSSQGIEAELRTKFRAVKEGESVAVIVDRSGETASLGNASSTREINLHWWQKVFRFFGL